MKNYKELEIKSSKLKDANLNESDLDIVMYAVAHHLVANLNDKRSAGCEGVVNGIFHALKSQGRQDLNELVNCETLEHASIEML